MQESKLPKTSSETEEMTETEMLVDKLDMIMKQMADGFGKLHEDFDTFMYEVKTELTAIKTCVRDLEISMEYTQAEIEEIKENVNSVDEERSQTINKLQNEVKP